MASDILNQQLADTLYEPKGGVVSANLVFSQSTLETTTFSTTSGAISTINFEVAPNANSFVSYAGNVFTVLTSGIYRMVAVFRLNFGGTSTSTANNTIGVNPIINGAPLTNNAEGEPYQKSFRPIDNSSRLIIQREFLTTFATNDTLKFEGFQTGTGIPAALPVGGVNIGDLSFLTGGATYPNNLFSARIEFYTST